MISKRMEKEIATKRHKIHKRILCVLCLFVASLLSASAQTNNSRDALFTAIQRGSIADVEHLLKTGVSAGLTDAEGTPALMVAALFADARMMELLHATDIRLGLVTNGEHWMLVALTVSLALVGVVLWGTLIGSLLPFLLRRLGFDPATSSAPFVATLVDVTGIVIYFSIASLTLRGSLL